MSESNSRIESRRQFAYVVECEDYYTPYVRRSDPCRPGRDVIALDFDSVANVNVERLIDDNQWFLIEADRERAERLAVAWSRSRNGEPIQVSTYDLSALGEVQVRSMVDLLPVMDPYSMMMDVLLSFVELDEVRVLWVCLGQPSCYGFIALDEVRSPPGGPLTIERL